jgi:F5/8 type C domain-containing protein
LRALIGSTFILSLAGLAAGCELIAGIQDISLAPADASHAVVESSSGGSQTTVDEGTEDAMSAGSSGSGAMGNGSGSVVPTSGVDTSGITSGSSTGSGSASGSNDGGTSGSAGGSASGSGTGAADGGPKCQSNQLSPTAAVASSVENQTDASAGIFPPFLAIDGNFSTRWGSLFMTDPSWIYVDFGAPVFVDEVDILWESACAIAYDIDVSNDTTTWTLLKSVTGAPPSWSYQDPPPGWNNDAGLPTADIQKGLSSFGRYLRINGTARCLATYGYSIWEMRALGDKDANCRP